MVLTVPAPFMLPYAMAAAARLKRARSVLIMHDLYPDVLVASGLLKPGSLLAKIMRGLNALMFRALDAVVIIGRDTERLLLRYGGMTPAKISVHSELGDAVARYPSGPARQSVSPEAHGAALSSGSPAISGFTHDPGYRIRGGPVATGRS